MAGSAKLKRIYLFNCGHFTAPPKAGESFRALDNWRCYYCDCPNKDRTKYSAAPEFRLAWAWEDQAE